MTKKEKNKEEERLDSIFDAFDFGSYTVNITATTNVDTPTLTWDVGNASDYVFTDSDWSTLTTNTVTTSTIDFGDPYSELEELRAEKEKNETLRKEHPSLQEAYDNYQLVKKLVEDTEFDKTFERRYEGFAKK